MSTMLLGKKIGMTQVYDDKGVIVPVTVIQAGPCPIMQVKTQETDGYDALQLGFGQVKPSRRLKPEIGHARKAGAVVPCFVREVRLSQPAEKKPGEMLTVEVFQNIAFVDVVGTTKGKGYQGVMKRHHFKGQPASHGCERKHRSPGSISSGVSRGHGQSIKKGHKMAGHMGHVRATSRNLRVIGVDVENNLLIIKGPVAGPTGGYVMVQAAKTRQ